MSCKLILKFKDSVISEDPIEQEETTIGRREDNSIQIDNLAVSGKHARIIKIGSKAILEDLKSTNGTLINDQVVTKHVLQNGDVIQIGKHSLVFVNLDQAPAPAPEAPEAEDDMDKTMILSPQARANMMAGSKGTETAPAPAAPTMPLAGVQVIAGNQMGKKFELSASLTSLGKGDACKIKVKGFTVSKQASVITRRPSGYHITHLEGLAKTRVNGETVGEEPRTLKDGDIIELGDTKLEFYLIES